MSTERLTIKGLLKKSVARALMAPGNIITGVGCAGLAWATNPLPLILYGLGSGIWVVAAVLTHRYDEEIVAEEDRAIQSQAENAQVHLQEKVRLLFSRSVVRQFINEGFMSDYMSTYEDLVAIRDEAASVARDRPDVARILEDEIIGKLDRMLNGFLRLANARIMFAYVLFGIYGDTTAAEPEKDSQDEGFSTRLRDQLFEPKTKEHPRRNRARSNSSYSGHEFKSPDERIAELTNTIAGLERQAQDSPNLAEIYLGRVQMLKKRILLLQRAGEQDQRVTAQLEAMPDAFQYILDNVRAAQFPKDQVTNFMTNVIDGVDETMRLVEVAGLDDSDMNLLQFPQQQANQ